MKTARSNKTSKPRSKSPNIAVLIIALIIVLLGGVLFVGAVSGWFGETKVTLDSEYYTDTPELIDITASQYDELIANQKSFLLFVDQGGCTTADRLRGYAKDYAAKNGINIYRIMFSSIKDLSLHDYIKFYPSMAVVEKGKVRTYLRADSDAAAEMYNNYDAFESWLNRFVSIS